MTLIFAITLYYDDQGGTEPDGAYDFYATVQHEVDEVLGTSSCISTSNDSPADSRTGAVKRVITSLRGTSSAASAAKATLTDECGAGIPSVVDLYRYSGAGTLILDSSLSTKAGAYFSYDGGATKGADGVDGSPKHYNTLANGDDYADFLASAECATDEAIQNATGCPGQDAGINIATEPYR